ncbi:MAG TPA: 1,4-alpha-glucan branching protein GlgB [Thermoanaerobaculia bacterium]|nr:1,4-alpha-glucan branching protein GlgB [Thermoanaerobaculia bacterium]
MKSLISAQDLYFFNEGTHYRLYERLGAHPQEDGTFFAVWAPDAESVSVIGEWNGWTRGTDPLSPRGSSGVWEGFVAGAGPGMKYKYHIASRFNGYRVDKADPFAFYAEVPPLKGSVIWDLAYEWGDSDWMAGRGPRHELSAPMSVYEVHLGSWRRVPEEGNRSLTYREAAPLLAEHVKRLGFTHIELLPIMEHPFYGSWGYQSTGFFSPTSRFGTPQDFMYLVDHLHQQGIGVILDWVPSHFPTDEHGLAFFDGTHLYEHADPRKGFHPDWGSLIFNYGRREVCSFLISSAVFWLEKYHVDGLRVDAVASMLYLDYSRKAGEWIPNQFGGRENLEAIEFLRAFNGEVYQSFPDTQTTAEESTAWPMVSRPLYVGGLGFGYKWDMGWMHDTLAYLAHDPIHRRYHHNQLTFRGIYAWNENFVLPLSHDEVVHGKGSLYRKMPGDPWQKLANLRLLYGWMYGQPGKKLLFMGAELAQEREWNHDSSLDWHLLQNPGHAGIQRWLEDLNRFYREEPALHELDSNPDGFEWVDANDADNSVLSFLRWGKDRRAPVLVLYNFTPIARDNYRVGVPSGGYWRELLNSDSPDYGGSGRGNLGGVDAVPIPLHGRPYSLTLSLPPLAVLFLQPATPATVAVPEAPPEPEPELELESDPEPEPEEPSTPETPETPEEPEAPPSPS